MKEIKMSNSKWSADKIKAALEELGREIREERDNPDPAIDRKPGIYDYKGSGIIDIYQDSKTGYWYYGKGMDCHNHMTKRAWLASTYLRPTTDEYFDSIEAMQEMDDRIEALAEEFKSTDDSN
jgi:hypothetical protein